MFNDYPRVGIWKILHKSNYKIKVEILNIQIKRSTAQVNGVGEIPLNGKGMIAIPLGM